jgi:CubicO group peptidase (beta-lactamase class C family)
MTIQQILDNAVASGDIPCVAAAVTGPDDTVFQGAAGGVDADTSFWIASMTKPITSVAAMQLVEQGKLSLDAPIGDLLPELQNPQIIESGTLRPAQTKITLRHLLTHTSGFSYPFASAELTNWQKAQKNPPPPGTRAWLNLPLLFEPGARWEYGISTDWVGLAVEAASGLSLDAYFAQHIFSPLGMVRTGFAPSTPRAALYQRQKDGSLRPQPPQPEQTSKFFSGGGGLYSTCADYLKFLRIFLNQGSGIISPASVTALSVNQIGTLRAGALPSVNPDFANDSDAAQGVDARWTLGFMLFPTNGPAGRNPGSLAWAGAANTYFWIDPAINRAGIILMQILPAGDAGALKTYVQFERAVYDKG